VIAVDGDQRHKANDHRADIDSLANTTTHAH